MIAWLSSFKNHEEDMLRLCQFAYEARKAPCMKELNKRYGKSSTTTLTVVESNESNFLTLRHYIGRLGSHVKAARTLVAAAMRFPAIFDNFEIECLASSKPAELSPLMDERTTLDGIIDRMFKNGDTSKADYQGALNAMNNKFNIY